MDFYRTKLRSSKFAMEPAEIIESSRRPDAEIAIDEPRHTVI
jgi:hypothetical protein